MKRKNPSDSTLRNVQAANKKFAKMQADIKELKKAARDFRKLERKLRRVP